MKRFMSALAAAVLVAGCADREDRGYEDPARLENDRMIGPGTEATDPDPNTGLGRPNTRNLNESTTDGARQPNINDPGRTPE